MDEDALQQEIDELTEEQNAYVDYLDGQEDSCNDAYNRYNDTSGNDDDY